MCSSSGSRSESSAPSGEGSSFLEVQAERVDRQRIAVNLAHLVHGWRVIAIIFIAIRFDDDLHSELQATTILAT
jgi:hypothetical protein